MAASSLLSPLGDELAAPAVSASTTGVRLKVGQDAADLAKRDAVRVGPLDVRDGGALTPSRQCSTRWNCSPMMNRPDSGSR